MKTAMRAMEPAMRKGMSEAYAVTFTATEMRDIAGIGAKMEKRLAQQGMLSGDPAQLAQALAQRWPA